jgi:(p)ppGpp synthase/HD superfamily hydrolase
MASIVNRARKFATIKHLGQKRKDSSPYIIHPIRVAEIIKQHKKSHKLNELVSAALLHDTLEDTNTSEQELKIAFGSLVVSLVKELTSDKEKSKINKKEYLTTKMLNMSSWALAIKLADRLDNVSDLFSCNDEKFKQKYIKDTDYILKNLVKHRKLSKTQKILVNKIKNRLSFLKN